MINESLRAALSPITIVVGHYGVGKTNFALNLALDLAAEGNDVTLIDLDIVNPYFRATEHRETLEKAGLHLIAPVYAEAGSSLDSPSLTGRIEPALNRAGRGGSDYVIVDAGGDDVGATALGRFSRAVEMDGYSMLYVLNCKRSMTQDASEALEILREIEVASHLKASALVSNAHLKADTTPEVIEEGYRFASEVSAQCGLPIVSVTTPLTCEDADSYRFETAQAHQLVYDVEIFVKAPWE